MSLRPFSSLSSIHKSINFFFYLDVEAEYRISVMEKLMKENLSVKRLLSKLSGLWLPQIQIPQNSSCDVQSFDVVFSIYVTRALDVV